MKADFAHNNDGAQGGNGRKRVMADVAAIYLRHTRSHTAPVSYWVDLATDVPSSLAHPRPLLKRTVEEREAILSRDSWTLPRGKGPLHIRSWADQILGREISESVSAKSVVL